MNFSKETLFNGVNEVDPLTCAECPGKIKVISVKEGIHQGRRPDLVGGGLIRSLGVWVEARKLKLKRRDRIKGDEWILGNSNFVMDILSEVNERANRRYELNTLGYDFDKLEQCVLDLYHIERAGLYSKSRQKVRAEAGR